MHFDTSINLGNVLTLAGVLGVFVKMALTNRDMLRDACRDINDLRKCIGSKEPPMGILGDIHHNAAKLEKHDRALERAGWLDRRVSDRRGEGNA